MDIHRRALYNSLRMNWIIDPSIDVEPWQIEDYRSLPIDEIFERLDEKGIHLDKITFSAFSDSVDTPEDLADGLVEDLKEDILAQDQVYLLAFELWRRLLPEKPSLSIFCDEMDYQIHLCDSGQAKTSEGIQDALANLQVILNENSDEGADPVLAFDCIDAGCANDVESFLYDFIAEQIDSENDSYALELLDGFSGYVRDARWFYFLRARVLLNTDLNEAKLAVKALVAEASAEPSLEFNLEVLSFLVRVADQETFDHLVNISALLIELEEDFQDLVAISADFYHCIDQEPVESGLQIILNRRAKVPLHKRFDRKDPDLAKFLTIISQEN